MSKFHSKIIKNMKIVLNIIAFFFTLSSFAQTHEIIKHDGVKMQANFVKMENNLIYYSLPEKMELNAISKYAVAELKAKSDMSSRVLSEKIDFKDKIDFDKVVLLDESETAGLKKGKAIDVFLPKAKGESPFLYKNRVERKLKQKAAETGSPFVSIVSQSNNRVKAEVYSY
jgi:hypothetical protein